MDKKDDSWKSEIAGLVLGWGKYSEAASIAALHGADGVLFAMQTAYKDGFNRAAKEEISAAALGVRHDPV